MGVAFATVAAGGHAKIGLGRDITFKVTLFREAGVDVPDPATVNLVEGDDARDCFFWKGRGLDG